MARQSKPQPKAQPKSRKIRQMLAQGRKVPTIAKAVGCPKNYVMQIRWREGKKAA